MTYPEHEKLDAVKERSQAIGEFLDFGTYTLCRWVELDKDDEANEELIEAGVDGMYQPVGEITKVLAEHFGIDLNRLEDEKRQMLDEQRALNARRAG